MLKSGMTEETDILYYNARLVNNLNYQLPASINDTRSRAILQNPSEYQASIVRFEVNGNTLPLLIPNITNPNTAGPYLTSYSVCLKYNGFTAQEYVRFSPSSTVPRQIRFAYYTFTEFLSDLNAAYLSAFNFLLMSTVLPVTAPPVVSYNMVTKLFSVYVQDGYLSDAVIPMNVCMNYDLFCLFTSFEARFKGYNVAPLFDDYTLTFTSLNSNLLPAVRTTYPLIVNSMGGTVLETIQEFPSNSEWSPVSNISLQSYKIPIENESVPVSSKSQQNFEVSSSTLPIFTDFVVDSTDVEFSRSQIIYLPTAEYRMVSLKGDTPFNQMDVIFYWADRKNNIYPLLLDPGYSCSIKIMFRKK